jgi:Sel1 repeat
MRKHYVVLLSLLSILLICASFWGFNRYRHRFERNLLRSAQSGDAKSQFELAKAYQNGWRHFPKDEKAAFDWYSRAAAQGYAKAQDNLGFMYATGEGVKKDDVAAFQWFQKAALQGDPVAERKVGRSYEEGTGVPQDYMEAALWTRKAAEQGDTGSQLLLAMLYASGRGVQRDLVMAWAWYLVARAAGEGPYKDSMKKLADHLQKDLAAAEVSEAQQLASSWWTSHPNGTKMPEHSKNAQQTVAPKPVPLRHAPMAAEPGAARDIAVLRPRRSDCERGHWVQSVSDDGSIVALEDGSVWRISDVDTVDTALWMPTEDVIVCDGKLVNTDSSDTVEASRLK